MSTSVIHYQFKNAGDDFLSIYFEGPVLSTYELKRLIAQQRNIKLDLIDLVITDTETNEIYSDDRQVPKNTSVHVSRVNALKSRTLRSKTTNQATDSFLNDDNSNYYANDPMYASQSSSTSTWNALNKMTTQPKTTTDTYNPNQRRSTSSAYKQVEEQSKRFFNPSSKPLPANYVCKRCHTPGHHIKDCATNGDKLYEPAKAATGIPRSKMRLVSSTDDVDQTNVDSKLMLPGVGQVALIHNKLDFQRYDDDINQSSKTSNMQYGHNNPMSKQAPTQIVYEERDPRTLGINISCLCSLCGDVMNNVAKMTCCDFMGCESCLKKALIKDNPNCIPNDDDFFPCPNCGENMPYIDAIDINQDITNIINNWAYEHSFALDRQRWQDKYKNPNSILDSQGNEQQQNIHPSLSPMIHEPSGFDSSNNSSSSISSLSTGIPLPPPSNLLHDGTTNYSNPISIPSGLQPVEVPPPQAYNPPLLDPPVLDAIASDQSEDIPSTTAIATNDVYELPSTLRPVSPTPTAATNSKYQQNSYQHGYQHQQHHQHKNTYNKWYYGSTQHVNPSLNPHYNNDQSYQNDYPNSTNAPLQQDVNLGYQDQYADEADRTNSRDYNSRNISRDSSRDLDHNAQNISTDVDHPKNILVQLQNQDTETAESHIQVKKGPNRGRSRSRSRSHSPPRSRDYHRFKDRRSRSPGRHYDRRDNRRFNSRSRSRSRGYDRSRSPSRGYRSRTPSRSRSRSRGYDYSDYSDYSDDYSDYSDDNRDRRDNRDNKRGGASRMHDKGRRGGRGRGGRKFDAPSRGDQGQRDRNNAGGGGGGDRKRRRNRNRNSGGGRK